MGGGNLLLGDAAAAAQLTATRELRERLRAGKFLCPLHEPGAEPESTAAGWRRAGGVPVPLGLPREGPPPGPEGLSLRIPKPGRDESRYLEASHSLRWSEERAAGEAVGGMRRPFTQEK